MASSLFFFAIHESSQMVYDLGKLTRQEKEEEEKKKKEENEKEEKKEEEEKKN
jgi:hypothetical protein